MEKTTIGVLLVITSPIVREGIIYLLVAENDITIVGVAGNIDEALSQGDGRPIDVLLLGVRHVDPATSEAIAALQAQNPTLRVVVLAADLDAADLQMLIDAGIAGYVHRDQTFEQLVAALRAVAAGQTVFETSALQTLLRPTVPKPELTSRQREVLQLAANGLSNKQIARQLGITPRMVQAHSQEACARLGANNRTEAVARALTLGLITGPA